MESSSSSDPRRFPEKDEYEEYVSQSDSSESDCEIISDQSVVPPPVSHYSHYPLCLITLAKKVRSFLNQYGTVYPAQQKQRANPYRQYLHRDEFDLYASATLGRMYTRITIVSMT